MQQGLQPTEWWIGKEAIYETEKILHVFKENEYQSSYKYLQGRTFAVSFGRWVVMMLDWEVP